MGTFELNAENVLNKGCSHDKKEECIIALKVYDQCRQQDCLTPSLLGPARAAENIKIDGNTICEGDIIIPPSNAASVNIEDLRLKRVIIVNKERNTFRPGFWDVELKYVFKYKLIFFIGGTSNTLVVRAISIFTKKVTLFGSIGSDITISTDLFCNESETLDADPFVLVEAKALALAAKLKYPKCDCCCEHERNFDFYDPSPVGGTGVNADEVLVTIGLFTIIKLFRVVNLLVDSRGFCVPEECEEISNLEPCEFFESLDFPFDIFSPPQKREFMEDIAGLEETRRK